MNSAVGRDLWPWYLTGDVTDDGGFRKTGGSRLRRIYFDAGWRGPAAELHLNFAGADNLLGNPGATPVQALAADRSNIFTAPNSVTNQYAAGEFNGVFHLGWASMQAVAYGQTLTQRVPNGITRDVTACGDGMGLLCNPDGTVVTGPGGQPVADFLHGGPYSGLSIQTLVAHGYGGSLQVSATRALAGWSSRLVAGVSYDGSDGVFAGAQAIGGFNPWSREYIGPGVIQDQPIRGGQPRPGARRRAVVGRVCRRNPDPGPRLGCRFRWTVQRCPDRPGGSGGRSGRRVA